MIVQLGIVLGTISLSNKYLKYFRKLNNSKYTLHNKYQMLFILIVHSKFPEADSSLYIGHKKIKLFTQVYLIKDQICSLILREIGALTLPQTKKVIYVLSLENGWIWKVLCLQSGNGNYMSHTFITEPLQTNSLVPVDAATIVFMLGLDLLSALPIYLADTN